MSVKRAKILPRVSVILIRIKIYAELIVNYKKQRIKSHCDNTLEFQIEILRKHLGNKVRGVFYGTKVEVRDPVTNLVEKKSLKPFLINQTTLLLERGQLRIPSKTISEVIHRQMVNYQVVRVSNTNQEPIYSSEDEHGLDAMVFALSGFIEDYPDLINIIDKIRPETSLGQYQHRRHDAMLDIDKQADKLLKPGTQFEHDEPTVRYRKVPLGFSKRKKSSNTSSLGWGGGKNGGSSGGLWR